MSLNCTAQWITAAALAGQTSTTKRKKKLEACPEASADGCQLAPAITHTDIESVLCTSLYVRLLTSAPVSVCFAYRRDESARLWLSTHTHIYLYGTSEVYPTLGLLGYSINFVGQKVSQYTLWCANDAGGWIILISAKGMVIILPFWGKLVPYQVREEKTCHWTERYPQKKVVVHLWVLFIG